MLIVEISQFERPNLTRKVEYRINHSVYNIYPIAMKLCKQSYNILSLCHTKFYKDWSTFSILLGPSTQLSSFDFRCPQI